MHARCQRAALFVAQPEIVPAARQTGMCRVKPGTGTGGTVAGQHAAECVVEHHGLRQGAEQHTEALLARGQGTLRLSVSGDVVTDHEQSRLAAENGRTRRRRHPSHGAIPPAQGKLHGVHTTALQQQIDHTVAVFGSQAILDNAAAAEGFDGFVGQR